LISGETVSIVSELSRFLTVNTQTNSANTGYNLITKYPRADYVCIDEAEARLAYSDRFGDLSQIARRVARELGAKTVCFTRGSSGSLVYGGEDQLVETPVFSREVVDATGAGDAFLSVTSLCVRAGFPPELVGFVGNAIGALAIRILGNRETVDPATFSYFVETLLR
jgi:sugar/nucleoside kinase (ribokinase family)